MEGENPQSPPPPPSEPPPYAPATEPRPAAPPPGRGGIMRPLVIGVTAVVVLAALAGGAAFAHLSLTSTYSPQKAVADYFAAMGRGDVDGMMSNATFLSSEGSDTNFFGKGAVTAMMAAGQNRRITDVRVGSPQTVDGSTSSVKVTVGWAGVSRILEYKVRKDPARAHFLFYDSWRVEIPFTTINLTLPNQAGVVQVDGIALQASPAKKADVIQGFHTVAMQATDFYPARSMVVDGVGKSPDVTFPSDLSASATAAAAAAIKAAFGSAACDL